jgi:glucokinase
MKAGIDIGGTFVKFAFEDNESIKTEKIPVKHYIEQNNLEALLEDVVNVLKNKKIEKLGIAVAGLVNKQKGYVDTSPNIKLIERFPLTSFFEEKLNVKVFIENDANAAALGEYKYGNGKGSKILITLTLGTGLGSGAVINGKLLSGVNGVAMEFGHTTVEKNGFKCHCGRNGCIEAYVSSYGLERIYFLITDNHLTSTEIINLANQGKKDALEAFEIFNEYLSTGLMNLVHIFNPDKILLSGGIPAAYPLIIKMAMSKLKEKAFPVSIENLEIDLAKLGEYSGAYGALALTYQEENK